MASGLQEWEIRERVEQGGHIRNVLVVSKCVEGQIEHLAYIRPSWHRDYLPLRTWQDKGDRTYRSFTRLAVLIRRDFKYYGYIIVHNAGDPQLRQYRYIAHEAETKDCLVPPDCCISNPEQD